ncbi:hypothetical protein CMT52_07690 [Elizabethkingia anophelis]|nr:hypothetical protein [Elizabethkingia anophelis]
MPHYWGNILVVTKEELVPKYYRTLNTLKSKIRRYEDKPYGIKKVLSGGNGRQMLISFDSLSKEIQDSIGDPRKMKHPLIEFFQFDPFAVRYFNEFEFEDGSGLKDQFKEEYITNASVLIAAERLRLARLAEWKKLNKTSGRGLLPSICTDIWTFNEFLPKLHGVKHTIPQSYRAFDRIWKPFFNSIDEGYNYESLISGKLKNKNRKLMTDAMISLLNDMFAGQEHKPTRTEIARQYKAFLNGEIEIISNETGEIYDSMDGKKYKDMSESMIIYYLGLWENKIGTYAKRSGNRQELMGQFIPYHSLEKVKEAGVLISIDDRQPPFFYDKGKRMWAYMGIDLASEAWICWVFGDTKEGLILEFYRQLVRNYHDWGINLPLGLECESSLNSSFTDTFLRNGAMFDNVRIEANNARGKKIERYFGKLRYEKEKSKEGWLGRPHAKKEDNQKGAGPDMILPQETIIQNSLYDIQQWNNEENSQYPGMSRWEVFLEKQTKNTYPTNWKAFLPHLGYKATTSCNAGIIRFNRQEYLLGLDGEIALGENLIRLMKYVEGKEFNVFWLDGNNGQVIKAMIYYDDMMLCDLVLKPVYSRSIHEMSEQGKLNRQLMSAYENTVNAFMTSRKREIEQVTIIDNRKKTLNNKFVIPGLEKYIPTDTPAPVLDTVADEQDYIIQPTTGRLSKGLASNFK